MRRREPRYGVPRSTLRLRDLVPTSLQGLRSRRVRALLSGLGVAIGIASIVAVLGVTRSSQSHLLAQLDDLGTNLLTVASGTDDSGTETPLPDTAMSMTRQLPGVLSGAPTAQVPGAGVYRNDHVPSGQTGGRAVRACDGELLTTLDAALLTGRFVDDGPYPVTVLGFTAARTLGVDGATGADRVWIGGHWYTVVGILEPLALAPEIDNSALVSFASAGKVLGYEGHPSRLYLRADPDHVPEVAGRLGHSANPVDPTRVAVSRPSDALTAQLAVKEAGAGLFLGLGAIALLVGAIGIANVMVIAVLERRGEIGVRRALGAARGHIAAQFLTESVVLAALGGIAGVTLGATATVGMAVQRGWTVLIPAQALWGGIAVSVVAGAVAGLYPALRAAYLAPTDALRTA